MTDANSRPALILLADDDPGDRKLTQRALKEGKFKNEVRTVEDGEEALDYLMRRKKYKDPSTSPRPDLLLIDLNMPRIDGRQVLQEMRDNPDCPNIPVIILTTSQQETDIAHCYELGVKSYVTKPVTAEDFFHTIQVIGEYWLETVKLPPNSGK